MRILEIQPTYNSPHVVLNPHEGTCNFTGKSVLIKVNEFYTPLFLWVDKLINKNSQQKLEFTFDLEYLDIPSMKRLLCFLKSLTYFQKQGGIIKINWCYVIGDVDNLEMGEALSQLLDVPFEYYPYKKKKAS